MEKITSIKHEISQNQKELEEISRKLKKLNENELIKLYNELTEKKDYLTAKIKQEKKELYLLIMEHCDHIMIVSHVENDYYEEEIMKYMNVKMQLNKCMHLVIIKY